MKRFRVLVEDRDLTLPGLKVEDVLYEVGHLLNIYRGDFSIHRKGGSRYIYRETGRMDKDSIPALCYELEEPADA